MAQISDGESSMVADGIRLMIASRVERHRQQLAHLESCYRDEMAKTWHLRNVFGLSFLWKEISILRFAINELEDLSSQLGHEFSR